MHKQSEPFRFLRLREVCRLTGLSRSQIYRLQAAGQFPVQIKPSPATSAWIEAEVTQWQADRIAESRKVVA
jgi:prophage regulatory protein